VLCSTRFGRGKWDLVFTYTSIATSGFFVRDGVFKFQVGTEIMRLTAGDSLLVPRNMGHAFVTTTRVLLG
jgi:mannose-6-phosphate isomerase-like protein (cupin superfamily)